MTSIVVGTAGHIDHGKSSLVRALTGIDPDRLKEEKERGITIELGFAHTTIADTRVAFVDVADYKRHFDVRGNLVDRVSAIEQQITDLTAMGNSKRGAIRRGRALGALTLAPSSLPDWRDDQALNALLAQERALVEKLADRSLALGPAREAASATADAVAAIHADVLLGRAKDSTLTKARTEAATADAKYRDLATEHEALSDAIDRVRQERRDRESHLQREHVTKLMPLYREAARTFITTLRAAVVACEAFAPLHDALASTRSLPIGPWPQLRIFEDSKFMQFMRDAIESGLVDE